MGMCTYVIGFKPVDEKYKNMRSVYDACKNAGVEIPKEVRDFFCDSEPDDAGVRIDELPQECKKEFECSKSCSSGIEIDIVRLPKDVTIIRFINSW